MSAIARDAFTRLINREEMVIKQMTGGSRNKWKRKMPDEVKIMKKMNKTNCPGVVCLKTYKRYLHARVHRVYMEYCPHGDLKRLVDRYRRFR